MSRKKVDWVVIGGADGETAHCRRCGGSLKLGLPQSISVFVAAGLAFTKDHAGCKDVGRTEPTPASVDEWLRGRDTGMSSRTICSVMTGRGISPRDVGYPLDSSDFGRCYRLLKLFPEWRPRLGEVAAKYPSWAPLVDAWDELTALYEEELSKPSAPKLYARMSVLLAAVRKADGWVNLGGGCSMKVGA